MELAYADRQLERCCTMEREMRKTYPPPVSKSLARRIKQLESATTVEDVLDGVGKWHALTGRGSSVFAGRLSANYRIIVQFIEVDSTAEVRILAVEDYH